MVRNKVLLFAFLAALSTYLTIYTVLAHRVASLWAFDLNGTGYWSYSGAMTFFPWPKGPQDILLPVVTRMNVIDEFIYLYLIKTWILILACLLLWALTVVYFFKAILTLIKTRKLSRGRVRVIH